MSEIASVFKDLNKYSKETLVSILTLGCFWIIPFMLFKPSFFDFPFYAQIALIFALTIVWLISTLITFGYFLDKFLRKDSNPVLLTAFIAIVLLNIAILIGYYYSTSFTSFLRYAYSLMLFFFVLQIIYFTIVQIKKTT